MKHLRITVLVLTLILSIIFIWLKAWFVFGAYLIVVALISIPTNITNLQLIRINYPILYKYVKWIFVVFVASILVYFTKTFVVDIFRMPSSSMEKSLNSGDVVVINKLLMGPRRSPNTPDQYFRAWGSTKLKQNDLIIFNFPEGDTLLVKHPTESYYSLKRQLSLNQLASREIIWNKKAYKSVDHRTRYVKRLIGLPLDTIQIKMSQLLVNQKHTNLTATAIRKFKMVSNQAIPQLNKLSIKPYAKYVFKKDSIIELTVEEANQIPTNLIVPYSLEKNFPDPNIFPHTYLWNIDNLGPLIVPAKGMTINLTPHNLLIYSRIIEVYENNSLKINAEKIYINGKESTTYCFKMNYYWVLGDNLPHSYDSRYWGFLPENHIIGISQKRVHFN